MMTTLAWVILPIEKRPLLRLRARVQQTGSRCSMQSALADCANLAADRALTRNAALSRRPAGDKRASRHAPDGGPVPKPFVVATIYGFRAAMQDMQTRMPQACEVIGGFMLPLCAIMFREESQISLKLR